MEIFFLELTDLCFSWNSFFSFNCLFKYWRFYLSYFVLLEAWLLLLFLFWLWDAFTDLECILFFRKSGSWSLVCRGWWAIACCACCCAINAFRRRWRWWWVRATSICRYVGTIASLFKIIIVCCIGCIIIGARCVRCSIVCCGIVCSSVWCTIVWCDIGGIWCTISLCVGVGVGITRPIVCVCCSISRTWWIFAGIAFWLGFLLNSIRCLLLFFSFYCIFLFNGGLGFILAGDKCFFRLLSGLFLYIFPWIQGCDILECVITTTNGCWCFSLFLAWSDIGEWTWLFIGARFRSRSSGSKSIGFLLGIELIEHGTACEITGRLLCLEDARLSYFCSRFISNAMDICTRVEIQIFFPHFLVDLI